MAFHRGYEIELDQYEYIKESVHSTKKIGSISFDLNGCPGPADISLMECHYLANQLTDSNVENLNFRSLSMEDDGLTAISAFLKHSNVKKLTSNSAIFGKDGLLALTSALKQSKIEYLDLTISWNHRTMGSDAIHILVNSLPLSNVTTLKLNSIDINLRCLKHLANTLTSTKITVLSLERCCLNDKGIKYLSKKLSNSRIQSLNLAGNKMSFDSLKFLADVLENTAITELNIARNIIKSTGAQYLAEKLSKSVVENLDIGFNEIGSEGSLAIGDVIHLTPIIKLNLALNGINSSGITSLAENLKKSNVKHLDLYNNNLQINGAQILANGMKDSELEYLNVDDNELGNVGIGIILDALQFTKITDFNLVAISNRMDERNIKFVTNAFKCLKLKKLLLILGRIRDNILPFFNELKTLIESNNLDEILFIKNKMNVSIQFRYAHADDDRNIRHLNINDVEYIFDAIKYFHMKKLNLYVLPVNNGTWIPSLVGMLIDVKNPISNLTTLNLDGNYAIGNEGAAILAENFKYLKLTRLDLRNAGIENNGVIAIAKELINSRIRWLNLEYNPFDSIAVRYLTNVVKKHPVKICLRPNDNKGFSTDDQLVLKNINYMFLRARLLVRAIGNDSPVKYDKDLFEHLKAYEIFKNVDCLWESKFGEIEYNYNRIDSQIKSNVTKNFLKIIGVVNSDEIDSDLLPTEIIIKICSYLQINDIKFD